MNKEQNTWYDAKGQVVYVKGSKKNRSEGLILSEMVEVAMLRSGTVTRLDGKVFYAPFKNGLGQNWYPDPVD